MKILPFPLGMPADRMLRAGGSPAFFTAKIEEAKLVLFCRKSDWFACVWAIPGIAPGTPGLSRTTSVLYRCNRSFRRETVLVDSQ